MKPPQNINATGGCITDVHIFTMKTLILEKEQCQLGQRSISSAINMPDVKKVGWDKELQQDVVLPSNSKKFIKKVIQKK